VNIGKRLNENLTTMSEQISTVCAS
jgi:hypothetical protein